MDVGYKKQHGNIWKARPLDEVVHLNKLIRQNHEEMDITLLDWIMKLEESFDSANVLKFSYASDMFDDVEGCQRFIDVGPEMCFQFMLNVDRGKYGHDGSRLVAARFKDMSLKSFWEELKMKPEMSLEEAEKMLSFFLHGAYCSIAVVDAVTNILPVAMRDHGCRTLFGLMEWLDHVAKGTFREELTSQNYRLAVDLTEPKEDINQLFNFLENFEARLNSADTFFDRVESNPQLLRRMFYAGFTQNVINSARKFKDLPTDEPAFHLDQTYNNITDIEITRDVCQHSITRLRAALEDNIVEPKAPPVRAIANHAHAAPPSPTPPPPARDLRSIVSKPAIDKFANTATVAGKKRPWIDDAYLNYLRRKLETDSYFTREEADIVYENPHLFKHGMKRIRTEYFQNHKQKRDMSKSPHEQVLDTMLRIVD
jgi:hypothetical protein